MKLINDKDIHSIIIKLDKNKPRECEFRQYLDSQVNYGIDRKETILRMWEFLSNKDSIVNLSVTAEKNKEEVENELDNSKVLKMDELSDNIAEEDWEGI